MPTGYHKDGSKFTPPNRKGCKFTEEQCIKMKKVIKDGYENGKRKAYHKGKKLSEEHKRNISNSMKGKIPLNLSMLHTKEMIAKRWKE